MLAERLLRLLGVVIVATVVCATFGALHNQVSYTVSPDYFHAFKFHQFEVAEPLRNRIGASLVGVGASWWMGVPLGLFVGVPSMLQPTRRAFFRATANSILAILLVTIACGAVGWAIGALESSAPAAIEIYPGVPVRDTRAFLAAGMMHDFSYLGAAVGLVPAIIVQIVVWRSETRRMRRPAEAN